MDKYPTRGDLPVHPDELRLPPSDLDLNNPNNWNNHHLFFEKSRYLGHVVMRTLRNLERSQVMMQKDRHNMGRLTLHHLYGPPKPPTLTTAMEQIDEARAAGEQLKIYNLETKQYEFFDIGDQLWDRLNKHYNKEAA